VETAIEEGAGVSRFQVLRTAADALELRFEAGVADPDGAFARARIALRDYLATQGLASVRIRHGRSAPLREPRSGKLRRVCHAPGAAD
jgi:hypothetical protein